MRTYDLSPLFRSAIGFDRLANTLESIHNTNSSGGYPPYNIELVDENQYTITMAVAGFTADDLEIEVEQNKLRITGQKKEDENGRQYLHRGIANRNFERSFQLADHIKVASANIQDGMLYLELVREIPEAMKPRRIEIQKRANSILDNKVEAA
ncbi:Hsp20 family protein [Sedimenticola selenatireducens]|uniref:Hsp20 family protein n=1 Tax=Sedimenticola selenatireducens TaxID=191960 RepID=A0A557SK01_9GAMM|nr:Hsp20 family protein [Sedimenticola selenatireducens]TVO77755.1 Hsp20 family protein [Sedimenticola selenatireducens]TVT65060.1 MAG: Hsp20 family protein [Sedimenticola selenatireducens]